MNENLNQLRQQISNAFDKNGIAEIFFELGLDVEEAPGWRKSEWIRYLILTAQKQGRLPQLVAACRKRRSQMSWPELTRQDMAGDALLWDERPSWRRINQKAFEGGLYGGLSGVLSALLIDGLMLALGNFELFYALFLLFVGLVLGIAFGMTLGCIEAAPLNKWLPKAILGGVGGLFTSFLAAMVTAFWLGEGFLVILLSGVALGAILGSLVWATHSIIRLIPFFYELDIVDFAENKKVVLRRYNLVHSVVTGAAFGLVFGALFGVLLDLFTNDPFFGTTTAVKIPPTLTESFYFMGWGVFTGALFMVVYRTVARQLQAPPPSQLALQPAALTFTATVFLTFALLGLRPLGHLLMTPAGPQPYEPREYVGRVVSDKGQPIDKANVTLILEGIPLKIDTDTEGVYRIELTTRTEEIEGVVNVLRRGYEPYTGSVLVDPQTTLFPDIQLTEIISTLVPLESP